MRVGVMASGRGSNFQALIDAAESGETPDVELVHLIVNKKGAYAIQRAKKHGIEHTLITSDDKTRREFDQDVLGLLKKQNIEVIVLAGFMRILTPEFIDAYRNRILNIHPSLLPSFPGAHAHRDAIKYGVKVSGCTAHLVDEGIDSGPIIMQTPVTVSEEETEESLANKILEYEHQMLPKALQLLCSGKIIVNGRHIEIKSD
ncbi:MAG: phosphoribosylglycinamide formyltransferase [Gammaproteobacteria bacterium]|nr:phosphoribosylglycinamide formyltransferase [Gammaproteobacteria bacterium]